MPFFAFADKKANYDVKVSQIDITPYPIKGGRTTTFSITAETGNELQANLFLFFPIYHIHVNTIS